MDEIEKYETFMRGAFAMLEYIRIKVSITKPSCADDLEKQLLTPCEEEWKQALDSCREFNGTKV